MTQPLLPDSGGLAVGAEEPPRPVAEGFRVIRWLGSGAAAHVWLVAEERGGAEYALKVFRPQNGPDHADAAAAAEADRERQLLGAAAHDHLVTALRMVPTDAGPGLLLQHAAGGSLGALVAARGPLSVAETVTVLTPIAQALAFLHARGMTHGDVAPGNVLFTEHGKPLLSDFGVARPVGSVRSVPGGTPGFFAPEAAASSRPDQGLEPDADVYALAALGWYMLTGRVPARTAKRPPLRVMVPDVPVTLVELLEAGLSEAAAERPGSEEFARRAFRAARPEPVDLAAAVHPSVAPKLLTRRIATGKDRRPVLSQLLGHIGRGRVRGTTRRRPSRTLSRSRSLPSSPRAERKPRHEAAAATGRAGRVAGGRRHGAVLAAGLLAVGLAAAVLVGAAIAGAGRGTPPATVHAGLEASPAAPASPGPGAPARATPGKHAAAVTGDDPAAAVEGLTWLRTEALLTRDARLLAQVNAEGSPAMAADREVIAALEEREHRFSGLSVEVSHAAVVSRAGGVVEVAATVTTSGFEQRDAGGRVVAAAGEPKVQRLVLALVRERGRWLISSLHDPPR
ncbi:serine/threonine-protein kinase [Arthrobacter crystallopoietes]|uniref:serine/threonine-protein kinase n=1 Tax=Crystallibacter crystallopoietes TaxID=37928 RepID=UPI003D22693D